ncbi:MAG: hypothetical protein VYA30_15205 [Myxococcota bacterium]|nr:hypothetical protein [Myxococcota bacterium]
MGTTLDAFKQARTNLGLGERVDESFSTIYRPVADWVAASHALADGCVTIGINGAQGSGKSTFCALLKPVLEKLHQLKVVILSIDDVYHTRATRSRLSQDIHPLCQIRGVPGTHDVALALQTLNSLKASSDWSSIPIPRFDKASDDRRPEHEWDVADGSVDVVLFEGWCVGCPPMKNWTAPYNEREAREDPNGVWAKWSIKSLETDYNPLFEKLDGLVMIKVPSMETVRNSRWLQEKTLRAKLGVTQDVDERHVGLMTKAQVFDYVALFERATEHMLRSLPKTADVLIDRDAQFRYRLRRLP